MLASVNIEMFVGGVYFY